MDRIEIMQRLNALFREVFDDEDIQLCDETTADDIAEWDSMMHLNLIVAIEGEFGMKFTMIEVVEMNSIGDMVGVIGGKLA